MEQRAESTSTMNVLKLQKKYPVLDQSELFGIIEDFRNIDIEEKGWAEKKDVINAVSKRGNYTYDEARETLKEVDVDASGHVELEDYVQLMAKLPMLRRSLRPQDLPQVEMDLLLLLLQSRPLVLPRRSILGVKLQEQPTRSMMKKESNLPDTLIRS